jgi:hypothetical protein
MAVTLLEKISVKDRMRLLFQYFGEHHKSVVGGLLSRTDLETMLRETLAGSDDELASILADAFADAVYRAVPRIDSSDSVHIRSVLQFLDQQPQDLIPIEFYVGNTTFEVNAS